MSVVFLFVVFLGLLLTSCFAQTGHLSEEINTKATTNEKGSASEFGGAWKQDGEEIFCNILQGEYIAMLIKRLIQDAVILDLDVPEPMEYILIIEINPNMVFRLQKYHGQKKIEIVKIRVYYLGQDSNKLGELFIVTESKIGKRYRHEKYSVDINFALKTVIRNEFLFPQPIPGQEGYVGIPSRECKMTISIAEVFLQSLGIKSADYKLIQIENYVIRGEKNNMNLYKWRIAFKSRDMIPLDENGILGAGGEIFIEVDLKTQQAKFLGTGE